MALIKSDRKDFMSYSVPYTFIPGTKARAQEVNANFASITDSIDELDTSKLDLDLSNITPEGIEFIKNNTITRNIGEIFYTPVPITDVGSHLLDGTKISGEGIYNEFVKYIKKLYIENPTANYFTDETTWQNSVTQYGVCGKFVYDSENNTVRLPKVTGKIDGTTDINALGNLEPLFVRLPNITGVVDAIRSGNSWAHSYSGAFYDTGQRNQCDQANGGSYPSAIGFSASRSSSVYSGNGSNTAIHEQALKMFVYIVIANSTKTEIQSDIDEIATDLNGKADTDLTNTTNTGYIKMAGASMPGNGYINLTIGASGATYTAPADGWFYVHGNSPANTNFHSITIFYNSVNNWDTPVVRVCHNASSAGTADLVPVKKGQTIRIEFSEMTMQHVVFVYAVGSESEAS